MNRGSEGKGLSLASRTKIPQWRLELLPALPLMPRAARGSTSRDVPAGFAGRRGCVRWCARRGCRPRCSSSRCSSGPVRGSARDRVDAWRVSALGGRSGPGGRRNQGRGHSGGDLSSACRTRRTPSDRRRTMPRLRCSRRCARSSGRCPGCSSSPTSACASTRRTATAASSWTKRSRTIPASSSSCARRSRTPPPAPTSSRRPT